MTRNTVLLLVLLVATSGCDAKLAHHDAMRTDGGGPTDAAPTDASSDAAVSDGSLDAAAPDSTPGDAASLDGAGLDAPFDGGPTGDCVSLGPFTASAPFTDADHVSHPLPSFAVGSWYYVHTQSPGGGDRVLYSARAATDGALGAWQMASPDHGGGPHGFDAIEVDGQAFHFRNGHIARYPLTADGRMDGDVALLESDPDSSFGGNRYVWDVAVWAPLSAGGWVIHLGGFSFTGYTYRPQLFRARVPLGSSFERAGLDHPASRPGHAAVVLAGAGGFLFTREVEGGRLWRLSVAADGSLGAFEEVASLPGGTGNNRGDLIAIDSDLIAVRGRRVHAAHVSADGALGPWRTQPDLPEDLVDVSWGDGHLEGSAWGVIGDHLYLTGPKRVFVSAVSRGRPCE